MMVYHSAVMLGYIAKVKGFCRYKLDSSSVDFKLSQMEIILVGSDLIRQYFKKGSGVSCWPQRMNEFYSCKEMSAANNHMSFVEVPEPQRRHPSPAWTEAW